MIIRPKRSTVLILIVPLAIVLLIAVSLWIYAEYEAAKARRVLMEAERLKIGDSEASILPFIQRHAGYKWVLSKAVYLGDRKNWLDQQAYEQQLRTFPDYVYIVEVNPWGFGTVSGFQSGHRTRLDDRLRQINNFFPASLRHLLGMRDWFTGVQVSIQRGRVSEATASVFVEGRDEWLGHEWSLVTEIPNGNKASTYFVDGAALTMSSGGGNVIENFLTPNASIDQIQAAQTLNATCLTSIRGCDGACAFSRKTLDYLNRHPQEPARLIRRKCD